MVHRLRSACQIAVAATLLVVPASKSYAQDQCQCTAPGGEDSRIANAIGGGLFAGLIAAVIPFHHATALASAAPAGAPSAAAPAALTTMSDSTDIAPADSTKPRALASVASAPPISGFAARDPGSLMRVARAEPRAPLPSMTPTEAEADGMIAPKTATFLPALAMIGAGAMLIGLYVIRERRPRLRTR